MAYENKSGLGVFTSYGPRLAGGASGDMPGDGVVKEFLKDLTATGKTANFPVPAAGQGSAYVTEVDISQVTGTVSAQTIGGVDVSGATPEAPVAISSSNTGVIVLTGATGGKVLIKYKKYPPL